MGKERKKKGMLQWHTMGDRLKKMFLLFVEGKEKDWRRMHFLKCMRAEIIHHSSLTRLGTVIIRSFAYVHSFIPDNSYFFFGKKRKYGSPSSTLLSLL